MFDKEYLRGGGGVKIGVTKTATRYFKIRRLPHGNKKIYHPPSYKKAGKEDTQKGVVAA